MGKMIEFLSEGRPAHGYLASPKSKPGPGVLVLHSWWGLNDFFKKLCDRLATKGYTAFAPDLYGGRVAVTIDEAHQLLEAMDFEEARAIATNATGLLKERSHGTSLGAVGFSMGGAWAIFLSCLQPEDFGATVIFYGSETADYARSHCRYQGHFAEIDEWEPLEGIRQMEINLKEAGCAADFHIYPGVQHWFFESDRPEYNPAAARLAWERMIAFFNTILKPEPGETSSEAVLRGTGRDWDTWYTLLDEAGASSMTHPQIARYLTQAHEISPWWSQHITGHYERARGRRARHEMPSGFQISRSRTFAVPVSTLYQLWQNEPERRAWLGDIPIEMRRSVENKVINIAWQGSKVEVRFTAKGEAKSQVTLQQDRLPSADDAEDKKLFWAEAFNRLEQLIRGYKLIRR